MAKGIKDIEGLTQEQQDDLDTYHALKTLANSDGGKVLVDGLLKDIVGTIGVLENSYRTLSHIELIGHCAALSEKLSLMRILTRAGTNYDELKKLLKDALQE